MGGRDRGQGTPLRGLLLLPGVMTELPHLTPSCVTIMSDKASGTWPQPASDPCPKFCLPGGMAGPSFLGTRGIAPDLLVSEKVEKISNDPAAGATHFEKR